MKFIFSLSSFSNSTLYSGRWYTFAWFSRSLSFSGCRFLSLSSVNAAIRFRPFHARCCCCDFCRLSSNIHLLVCSNCLFLFFSPCQAQADRQSASTHRWISVSIAGSRAHYHRFDEHNSFALHVTFIIIFIVWQQPTKHVYFSFSRIQTKITVCELWISDVAYADFMNSTKRGSTWSIYCWRLLLLLLSPQRRCERRTETKTKFSAWRSPESGAPGLGLVFCFLRTLNNAYWMQQPNE